MKKSRRLMKVWNYFASILETYGIRIMLSKINQLRKLVKKGASNEMVYRISKFILHNELTFIEDRHLEDYFLVAHRLVSELKDNKEVLLGPGWGGMISSHICYVLGITNINMHDDPILLWGNGKINPTINIEVDEESYHLVYNKAIELFGFKNVARMPVMNEKNIKKHAFIGTKVNGEKVYLHACALLICLDGVKKHFDVEEVNDENGNKILCVREFVEEYDNTKVLRFNVLQSHILTRIKKIQKLLDNNGKDYPKMYEKNIWNEDYHLFCNGDLDDIPGFDGDNIQEITKKMIQSKGLPYFDRLLIIQGLYSLGECDFLSNKKKTAEYKKKYQLFPFIKLLPYGILYAEDAAWFVHGWIGLTWKQTWQVLQFVFKKKESEAGKLKKIYLRQGIDNGFKEAELVHIWESLFERTPLRSKSHYIGRLYLSIYLARLKHQFPEEFKEITEKDRRDEEGKEVYYGL